MTTHIEHSIDIAAPTAVVWALNTTPEHWPAITPTVTWVRWHDDGPLRVGRRATVKQPGQRATVWTVTAVDDGRLFQWEAAVFGVHMTATHLVEPSPDAAAEGATRTTLRLTLDGRGAGLMKAVLGGRLRRVLRTEAEGFRSVAEGDAHLTRRAQQQVPPAT